MLNILRNRLPDIEETGGAVVDRVVKAANHAAQSAKDVTVQLEGWAQEGVDCAKKRPLQWGAASLGLGAALLGGVWALWRQSAKPQVRTAPLRSQAKQVLRATKANGAAAKKSARKSRRNGASASA